jgi:hypothetical protein
MTTQFTAIVEQGLLRPTVPLDLPDGTPVEVRIVAAAQPAKEGQSPAEILAAIAALSPGPADPSTSVRHDEILYSRESHP